MTRHPYALALVAACLSLAGCAVDQRKEVAQYRQVLDQDTTAGADEYQPGQTLTLARALLLANRDNERLALQGETYLQSLIEKDRAATIFLPTVDLEPNYTIADRPKSAGGGAVGTIGGFRAVGSTLHRFEAPVVSRVNLFNGFGDVARLRRQEAEAVRQRLLLLDQQALVLLDVAQVYFQVLRSERLVTVLETSSSVQEERVRDVEARQNAGLARPLDVSQTRAQAAATRVSLITARSDVSNGRSTLATLLGVERVDGPLSYSWGDDLSPEAALAPLEAFEQRALESREDVRAAQAAIAAARQNVSAAVSQYYPSVSLNVTGFLYREDFSDASKWSAILNANIPIFSAGQIEADVRRAWSELRQAALADSLTRRQALQDVRIAYDNVTASRLRLRDLQTQVDAARAALEQAEGSYRVGLATNLERLAAQSDLLNAELQLVSERFDQALLVLDLTRFVGRLGGGVRTGGSINGGITVGTSSVANVGTGSGFNSSRFGTAGTAARTVTTAGR